jgi:signal transduction histidine kinase
MTYAQLFDRLRNLSSTTPVMITSVFRDGAGDTLNYPDFFARLREVYSGPIFSPQGNNIGHGAMGGKVVSQFEQGRIAAGLVGRLLAGTPAAELKLVADSPNLYTFDYRDLQRLGIKETRLPAGSVILNRPSSIFDEYAHWVFGGLVVILIQLALIAMLVVSIRQRKEAEGRLKQAIEVADNANRAKSAFLASMSHELRTPLNSIIGFSEMIRTELLGPMGNPKYAEFVGDIHDSGTHLLTLINSVLDLSKIEAGKMVLDEQSIPVDVLARDSLRIVEPLAKGGKININFIPPPQPLHLHADATKIKQVLINLLGNAVKFTNAGGFIDFEIHGNADEGVTFVVRDTGIGMTAENISVALSNFGQVEGHLVRKYEGTGLGLPLAKKLVDLHGGTMPVESTPGVGTTVTVRLPKSRVSLSESIAA